MVVLSRLTEADAALAGTANYVVMGAEGWMGRATIVFLFHALGPTVFQDRVLILGSRDRDIALPNGRSAPCRAMDRFDAVFNPNSVVFYYSFLTKDKVAAHSLEDYIAMNRHISDTAFALIQKSKCKSVILPSSGAVYDVRGEREIDIQSNPYGALKAQDEQRFMELMGAIGGHCVVPRIFGLSGEYINKHDAYALADFITKAQNGRPIFVKAVGPVYRSYMYIGDLIALTLSLSLRDGAESTVFDTAGDEIIEIGELAARVVAVLDADPRSISRKFDASQPKDWYVGDGAQASVLMRRASITPLSLDGQIRRTANYLATLA